MRLAALAGALGWPAKPGPAPAMVIHHGSGSVSDTREGHFARQSMNDLKGYVRRHLQGG